MSHLLPDAGREPLAVLAIIQVLQYVNHITDSENASKIIVLCEHAHLKTQA